MFNSLTEYIQVRSAGWGREGQSRIPRQAWRSRSPLPRSILPPAPAGPLHREPAEPGAQPPLGRRGGIPARLCPHDDEACSGSGPLYSSPNCFRAPPTGPFPSLAPSISFLPKCSRHVPDWFPPRGLIHLPSGLALCMTPPPSLPPPIGWFPIHTSIGLTFGPRPIRVGAPL